MKSFHLRKKIPAHIIQLFHKIFLLSIDWRLHIYTILLDRKSLDPRGASSWERHLVDLTSVWDLTQEPSSFSAEAKEFFRITFCIYVIGYLKCLVHEKGYAFQQM